MDPETATPTTLTAATPRLEVSLEDSGPFLRAAGLVFDEISAARVTGHLELGSEHHTPWGVVHGGVYTAAVETAASVGASIAVRDRGQVALGLTNTTHFLRAVTVGRVNVEATAPSARAAPSNCGASISPTSQAGSLPTASCASRTSLASHSERASWLCPRFKRAPRTTAHPG